MHVLLCGIVPPQGQDFAFPFVEFCGLISPSCPGPPGVSAPLGCTTRNWPPIELHVIDHSPKARR